MSKSECACVQWAEIAATRDFACRIINLHPVKLTPIFVQHLLSRNKFYLFIQILTKLNGNMVLLYSELISKWFAVKRNMLFKDKYWKCFYNTNTVFRLTIIEIEMCCKWLKRGLWSKKYKSNMYSRCNFVLETETIKR